MDNTVGNVILSENYLNVGQLAELNLIDCILRIDYFGDKKLQRLIALYPSCNKTTKITIIKQIINKISSTPVIPECLSVFENFEKFMIGLGIRDHFIHQFEVFILGVNILELTNKLDNKTVLECWLTTALCHDIGYPLEKAKVLVKRLKELYSKLAVNSIIDGIVGDKSFESMLRTLDEVSFGSSLLTLSTNFGDLLLDGVSHSLDCDEAVARQIITESAARTTHGLCSGYILYNIFTLKYGSLDTTARDALKACISAIFLHTCSPEVIKKINYKNNIFAYVLYIADNIQDWSRLIYDDEDVPDYILRSYRRFRKVCIFDIVVTRKTSKILDDVGYKEKQLLAPSLRITNNIKFFIRYFESGEKKPFKKICFYI